jgi:hypothetical protein
MLHCSLAEIYKRFRGASDAVRTSETSVNFHDSDGATSHKTKSPSTLKPIAFLSFSCFHGNYVGALSRRHDASSGWRSRYPATEDSSEYTEQVADSRQAVVTQELGLGLTTRPVRNYNVKKCRTMSSIICISHQILG